MPNREILFRGFYADENESQQIKVNGEVVKGVWMYGRLWGNAREQLFINNTTSTCGGDVIPKTVGQFTGLTDKNGRKIFENDVLLRSLKGLHGKNGNEVYHKDWQKVFFKNGGFVGEWFKEWSKYSPHGEKLIIDLNAYSNEFEVLGTIFDVEAKHE